MQSCSGVRWDQIFCLTIAVKMIFVGKFLKVATLTCKSKQKTFILDYEVKLTQVKNLLWCSEISKTFVATVTNNSEQKWAMSIRVELSQVI